MRSLRVVGWHGAFGQSYRRREEDCPRAVHMSAYAQQHSVIGTNQGDYIVESIGFLGRCSGVFMTAPAVARGCFLRNPKERYDFELGEPTTRSATCTPRSRWN